MTAEQLSECLESFLAEKRDARVLEAGEELFDFSHARYSVQTEFGKCLLHIWSAERNIVRRVTDAETKNGRLRVQVQRLGQAKPSWLEIVAGGDVRAPEARREARAAYQRQLGRVLQREFPDWALSRLSSAVDLERGFGPAYCRGTMRRGRSAFAVLGVNAQETQPTIDAALTFALLWLQHCREREAAKSVVEGLRLIVPTGHAAVVRERMAHLDGAAAKWELYELNQAELSLTQTDCRDRGNIRTRLSQRPDVQSALHRFDDAVARIRASAPSAEVEVLSPAEISFRIAGLEFARARLARESFSKEHEIVFGAGPRETLLTSESEDFFRQLLTRLMASRQAGGEHRDPLWRMQPERWLESLVARDVAALDPRLQAAPVYSQVPAFTASDRGMIDLLATTREGRLAVIELKADEDIHLPLQGVDYWSRVVWHHQRGEFQQYGYFEARELSAASPLLLLVAPALRVHPATDILLRFLAPEIDCTLIGIDERWRDGVRVVFRKRRS